MSQNMISHCDNGVGEAYELYPHQVIDSTIDQYEVLEFLGSGSFGKVLKCLKKRSNEFVAVKLLSSDSRSTKLGRREISILATINEVNAEEYGFVRTIEFFMYNDRICLVFEMLEQSLYDFLLYNLLPAKYVSYILKQLLISLAKLKQLGVIHTDLKPENIMVVDPTTPPYKIKVIDFGCALKTEDAACNDRIQTRWYRAPEIILGLPYGPEIDMWSSGCLAAEFFMRWPLYPGSHEYDQMRYICETQGLPPQSLLDSGSNTSLYFKLDEEEDSWKLRSTEEFQARTSTRCYEQRKQKLTCLNEISKVNIPTRLEGEELVIEKTGRKHIVDLLKLMLELDPADRITPEQALEHPAISELTPW